MNMQHSKEIFLEEKWIKDVNGVDYRVRLLNARERLEFRSFFLKFNRSVKRQGLKIIKESEPVYRVFDDSGSIFLNKTSNQKLSEELQNCFAPQEKGEFYSESEFLSLLQEKLGSEAVEANKESLLASCDATEFSSSMDAEVEVMGESWFLDYIEELFTKILKEPELTRAGQGSFREFFINRDEDIPRLLFEIFSLNFSKGNRLEAVQKK